MPSERFQLLIDRLVASNVAKRKALKGCTLKELAALESRYSLELPHAYRDYLRTMGHDACRLFRIDHVEVTYSKVFDITAEMRTEWREQTAKGKGPPPSFQLPDDALITCSRLGEQFEFIRCQGQEDTPVWYFNNVEWAIVESHPSILAWLECWAGQAEEAIAKGYFEFPYVEK